MATTPLGTAEVLPAGASLEPALAESDAAPARDGSLACSAGAPARSHKTTPPTTSRRSTPATRIPSARRRAGGAAGAGADAGTTPEGGAELGPVDCMLENEGTPGARRCALEGKSIEPSEGGGGIDDGISRCGSSPPDFT